MSALAANSADARAATVGLILIGCGWLSVIAHQLRRTPPRPAALDREPEPSSGLT